ncbi:ankyrin repeat domain-containing protein [Winogradskyella jejuensis]|uniref:Uncharacterized protein n=1 Tax=Winogradskyella jejuensis TaxID=1089305 RepID=A0A1M5SY55_9FLAO|nr:ankyrin repeat domain-containing protein [Winogradskyella jejuensis]SHH43395.1 hypothetical protein SAMN05444148_2007 [Winogradskyella jejuensis]
MNKKVCLFILFLSCVTLLTAQQNIFDACRQGDLDTVIKIYTIDENSINIQEETGYTPLVLACYYGHENIVEFLVDKVKSLNDKTSYGSPLMAATVKGYDNIVDILLANKVDPNITDEQGVTAAHYAVLFKNYDIVEKLVNANADFTIKNNVDKSALDYALSHNDEKLNKLLNLQKS